MATVTTIENVSLASLYVPMLLAGLAGSMHCMAMCGPLLIAFGQVFRPLEGGGTQRAHPLWLDFAGYHLGRIWTYGLLGLLAGSASERLRVVAFDLGLRRPLSLLLAILLLGSAGFLVMGKHGASLLRTDCGLKRLRGVAWFQALLHKRGLSSRFLLGAILGLLPCGLVYAMLIVAATMPSPLHSGLAMLAFGTGTLPALSAVLLASGFLAPVARRLGPWVVALTFLLASGLIVLRGWGMPAG